MSVLGDKQRAGKARFDLIPYEIFNPIIRCAISRVGTPLYKDLQAFLPTPETIPSTTLVQVENVAVDCAQWLTLNGRGATPGRRVLWVLAQIYGQGARKYADNNWKKGLKFSWMQEAARRHAWKHVELDEILDPEFQTPHLGHSLWHLGGLLWMVRHRPDMDDLKILTNPYVWMIEKT